jgi:class 3 adenylate cyclase
MTLLSNTAETLRTAGITATDSAELKIQKTLLVFATGLLCIASMLWLLLYRELGPHFSSTAPFIFQLILAGNLALYLKSGNFEFFRLTQLSVILFFPFAVQWSIGNFITASGISLWGLLAPIGAILIIGAVESAAWFIAYLVLMALSGFFDYYLANSLVASTKVPVETSVVFFGLNFAGVSTITYILLRYSAQERAKTQARLAEAHAMLQNEQARSERLLLNILPAPIATRLKNSEQTIADGFADVTVMFADIVNFTRVAEGLTPQAVFSMLNRIFSSFDELAEKHGLEKIKTIGDAYMVAGGINDDNSDYSSAIAAMALDMMNVLHTDFNVNQQHLEMRIGIGSGPVVAGVVGKKKFIYDLWGDTVNIASRITSEGLPGLIHVDESTHARLNQRFEFGEARTVSYKGKGKMTVYPLLGKLSGDAMQGPRNEKATAPERFSASSST